MPADDHPSTPNRFLLFVGGDGQARSDGGPLVPAVHSTDLVIAVDSGLHLARRLSMRVDHVVGDMDSVDPAVLREAEAAGATVHLHQADKDATDLELALDLALSMRGGGDHPPRLHVAGGGGGRLDHLIGDLLMLSAPRLVGWDVTARLGAASVAVARSGRAVTIAGTPGEQVSLLPVHGDARGVTTEGLRWPLVDGHLVAGTSRGVSNELADRSASVAIDGGTLVIVQPGTRGGVVEDRAGSYDPTPRPTEAVGLSPSPTDP